MLSTMQNANRVKTRLVRKHAKLITSLATALLVAILALLFIFQPATADFNSMEIKLEVVRSSAAQQKGLGGRQSLDQDSGMLFEYKVEGDYGIWMKDTLFPLDIVWLDAERTVTHIEKNIQPDSYPTVFRSPDPALYIIEVNAGAVDKSGLEIGQTVKLSL